MTTKITITLTAGISLKPEFSVTWADTPGETRDMIVERSTDGAPFAEVARVPPGVFKWLEKDLPEGHDYAFRMRPAGTVADLPTVEPTPPPALPPVVVPPVPPPKPPPAPTPAPQPGIAPPPTRVPR